MSEKFILKKETTGDINSGVTGPKFTKCLHDFARSLQMNVLKSEWYYGATNVNSPILPIFTLKSVRYLGVFIIRSCHFSSSFDNAKNPSTEVLMQSLVKLAG